jgi:hypothetical protein
MHSMTPFMRDLGHQLARLSLSQNQNPHRALFLLLTLKGSQT